MYVYIYCEMSPNNFILILLLEYNEKMLQKTNLVNLLIS